MRVYTQILNTEGRFAGCSAASGKGSSLRIVVPLGNVRSRIPVNAALRYELGEEEEVKI